MRKRFFSRIFLILFLIAIRLDVTGKETELTKFYKNFNLKSILSNFSVSQKIIPGPEPTGSNGRASQYLELMKNPKDIVTGSESYTYSYKSSSTAYMKIDYFYESKENFTAEILLPSGKEKISQAAITEFLITRRRLFSNYDGLQEAVRKAFEKKEDNKGDGISEGSYWTVKSEKQRTLNGEKYDVLKIKIKDSKLKDFYNGISDEVLNISKSGAELIEYSLRGGDLKTGVFSFVKGQDKDGENPLYLTFDYPGDKYSSQYVLSILDASGLLHNEDRAKLEEALKNPKQWYKKDINKGSLYNGLKFSLKLNTEEDGTKPSLKFEFLR